MMTYHYPDLNEKAEWALGVIATLGTENADYFLHEECPYEGRTLTLLQAMCQTVGGAPGGPEMPLHEQVAKSRERAGVKVEDLAEADMSIEAELVNVFDELKLYGRSLSSSDQTERMSYFRTATSLLEKLVILKERAAGVKQVKEFENAVLGVMEDILTSEQRTAVMDRLRSILSKPDNEPAEIISVE